MSAEFRSFIRLRLPTGAAYPVICIVDDGQLRIRELPVFINWLDE